MKVVNVLFILFILSSIVYADVKYPVGVVTDDEKLEFLYQAREELRLNHNARWQAVKDGELSKIEFDLWKKTDFRGKQILITHDINLIEKSRFKELIKTTTEEEANLDIYEKKDVFEKSKKHTIDLEDLRK